MARLQSRQISQLHLYQLLHGMRLTRVSMSRSQIAEMTGLSQPAVSSLTRRLLDSGALHEVGARPSAGGGRRERELALNPDHAWVVGAKLSLHQMAISLTDFAGGMRHTVKLPLAAPMSAKTLVKVLTRRIEAFLDEAGPSVRERLAGIAIALPGFIDSMHGVVHWSAVLTGGRGHHDVPLAQALKDAIGVPVLIENDANMLAMAEQWFGEAARLSNVAVVTLEHGLGLGLVLNGELYRGHAGLAAELAHLQVEPEGRACRCGKRGCLETLVTHDAMVREAEADGLLPAGAGAGSFESQVASFATLVALAEQGERRARGIFERQGRVLGQWLGNVVNLLAPQLVILDGGSMVAADLYEKPLREAMDAAMVLPHRGQVRLLLRHCGDEAWARGAASLVLQRLDESAQIVESVARHGVENEASGPRPALNEVPLTGGPLAPARFAN